MDKFELASKQNSQDLHAAKRFKERYHIDIEERDLRAMVWGIEGAINGIWLKQGDYPKSVWEITHYERIYYAVYDPSTRRIATFLPADDEAFTDPERRARLGVWRKPRAINNPTEDQKKIYTNWRYGRGTFIPDPDKLGVENWDVPLDRDRIFRMVLSSQTKVVMECYEIP